MNQKQVYCRYCGNLIDEYSAFCAYCGKNQFDTKQDDTLNIRGELYNIWKSYYLCCCL